MLDIPSISAIVAAAGVIVGVVLAVQELRDLARTRRTDLTLRLSSWWTSEEMIKQWFRTLDLEFKDYHDFTTRYGAPWSDKPEHIAIFTVMAHFDGMGYLLHSKMIDFGLVSNLPIMAAWKKVKPIVQGLREQYNPSLFQWFEYLYSEAKKTARKH